MTVVGIATFPRCHLDLPPLSSRPSPAVISNAVRDLLPRKEGFLAGARNDKGALDMTESTLGITGNEVSSIFVHPNSCYLQMTQWPVFFLPVL